MHEHRRGECKCVAIAPNVCLQPVNGGGAGISMADGSPVAEYFAGFIIGHDRDWDQPWRCEGFVGVSEQHGQRWSMSGTLEGGDLTLAPSILCNLGSGGGGYCGFHGFVQNGQWVPA